eukprot:TRINITY_DN1658_c0_g1_i4.p1 TRINITY_DN1658_c0_g1~~TRINITY_DN1658_c0_g1_i4.p1  ORF type:complete len:767 (-),score=150.10 TRINITY_DN1658_c0_g1_i4:190-2490(-)
MDFYAIEDRDAIRSSWNIFPPSRLEAARLGFPISCLYSPLKRKTFQCPYEPILCKACRSVLNPYCSIDFRSKIWVCPLCLQRNQFPPHYSEINEVKLPAELIPDYSTVEYVLPRAPTAHPIFLYVIDTCLLEEAEMSALKDSILMSLSLLPENSLVGLITYGANVQVHELAFESCPKSFVFRGNKETTAQQLQTLLGLQNRPGAQYTAPAPIGPGQPQVRPARNRFLLPLSECEFTIETILEELQCDPQKVKTDQRPLRCTGAAVSLAVSLLESTYPNTGARIMLFTGGPTTEGPGLVVSASRTEQMRAHFDIQKDEAKHYTSACKYFEGLGTRAAQNGHAIDIFACSLNQVGLAEMRELLKKTGGQVVMADSFATPVFKESFKMIFTRDEKGDLSMCFNGTLDVIMSKELKVCGAIGHLSSLSKKGPAVSETEIGIGETTSWKAPSLDSNSSYAFYFDVVNQHSNPIPAGQRAIIQFLTQFQNCKGQRIVRVTTVAHAWADMSQGNTQPNLSFDQEAAAVLMARWVVFRAESEEYSNSLNWLDKTLIRLMQRFAEYQKDNPASFRLPPNISLFPQFMYYLRRSHVVQIFNNSPDETTYKRYLLMKENTANSMIMIQPALEAFNLTTIADAANPSRPALLSATSIQHDAILLLDTFFEVVVHHGKQIADWRNQGYHNQPEFEHLKRLLEAPKEYSQGILKGRFPQPRYIECDQHSSQARFLLALVDPDVTHQQGLYGPPGGAQAVITEDVSLSVFMDFLKKLTVQG